MGPAADTVDPDHPLEGRELSPPSVGLRTGSISVGGSRLISLVLSRFISSSTSDEGKTVLQSI